METFVTIIHVLVSVFMMLVILLQEGKSGMGAIGGGTGASPFGPRGRSTPLSKATAVAAGTFMVTSMLLAWMSSQDTSVIGNDVVEQAQPAEETPGMVPATGGAEPFAAEPTGEEGPPAEAPVEGFAEEPAGETAPAAPAEGEQAQPSDDVDQ